MIPTSRDLFCIGLGAVGPWVVAVAVTRAAAWYSGRDTLSDALSR